MVSSGLSRPIAASTLYVERACFLQQQWRESLGNPLLDSPNESEGTPRPRKHGRLASELRMRPMGFPAMPVPNLVPKYLPMLVLTFENWLDTPWVFFLAAPDQI